MRRLAIAWLYILAAIASLTVIVNGSLRAQTSDFQATKTPTPEGEQNFVRDIEVPSSAVASGTVNIRAEPSLTGDLLRQAREGDKFRLRHDTEWVVTGSSSWVPVWVSVGGSTRGGWLEESLITFEYDTVNVPVLEEEVARAYDTDLPTGAVSLVARENQILAVSPSGQTLAVWEWGKVVGQGGWKAVAVPEFFRTIQEAKVEVIAPVRIRLEPGTSAGAETVLRVAQAGEEFDVRQEVESIENDGYTWIPVVADGEEAWIAEEGFLQHITKKRPVPIAQDEVSLAYSTPLPSGATEIVVGFHALYAINEEDTLVGSWNWRDAPGQGQWDPIRAEDVAFRYAQFTQEPQIDSGDGKYTVFFSQAILDAAGLSTLHVDTQTVKTVIQEIINRSYQLANSELRRRGKPTLEIGSEVTLQSDVQKGGTQEVPGNRAIQGEIRGIVQHVVTCAEFAGIKKEFENNPCIDNYIVEYGLYGATSITSGLMYFDEDGALEIITKFPSICTLSIEEEMLRGDQVWIGFGPVHAYGAVSWSLSRGIVGSSFYDSWNADNIWQIFGCIPSNNWCTGGSPTITHID